MSPAGVSKHLKVLERAGLIARGRNDDVMRHPQYGEFKNRVVYKKVDRPERLEYTHDSGVDRDPSAFEVTIVFDDLGRETKVTMRSLFSSVAELEPVKGFGAVEGGHQTLERLSEWLAAEYATAPA